MLETTAAADYLSIELMLKATPAQESGRRFIYLEASREERDQQNEVVLAKALRDSSDHYLKFGNVDIDHFSMPAIAKMRGIQRPELWEVGAPVDVRFDGNSTFVKAELFTGDTDLAEKANMVWESMTKLNPPRRWYPSVGGKVLSKSLSLDPKSGAKFEMVDKVRWTNIAISQQPVNQHVDGVRTIPFGVLAKSWGSEGLNITKALEASYATDAAGKTGGAALGMQSLDTGGGQAPHSYFDFRELICGAIKRGDVKSQNAKGLMEFAIGNYSLSHDEAAEWVSRLMGDLKSGLSKLKRSKEQ